MDYKKEIENLNKKVDEVEKNVSFINSILLAQFVFISFDVLLKLFR